MKPKLISPSSKMKVLASHSRALRVGDRVYLSDTSVPLKCASSCARPRGVNS